LTKGYYIFYLILTVLIMPFSAIVIIAQGNLPVPGLLGIAAMYALIKNRSICKRINLQEAKKPNSI